MQPLDVCKTLGRKILQHLYSNCTTPEVKIYEPGCRDHYQWLGNAGTRINCSRKQTEKTTDLKPGRKNPLT